MTADPQPAPTQGEAPPTQGEAPSAQPVLENTPQVPPQRVPPDALKPDIQCARTHWIRGFMAFQLAREHPNRGADGVGVT